MKGMVETSTAVAGTVSGTCLGVLDEREAGQGVRWARTAWLDMRNSRRRNLFADDDTCSVSEAGGGLVLETRRPSAFLWGAMVQTRRNASPC